MNTKDLEKVAKDVEYLSLEERGFALTLLLQDFSEFLSNQVEENKDDITSGAAIVADELVSFYKPLLNE